MDIKKIWNDVNEWITEPGIGQTLVVAALVYFLGGAIVRLLRKVVHKAVLRTSKDETLARFAATVSFGVLRLVVIIAVLGALGVDTSSLVVLLGGAGVGLGFAMRDTLSNFAAGILLIVNRPFDVGDFIEAGGQTGTVDEISIAATRLSTTDNKALVIPNGPLAAGVITNFSRKDTRRVDLVAGIAYGDDIDKAKGILTGILSDHPLVLAEPEPRVELSALADSSVNFIVRPWCKTEDYWRVHFDVTEQIKKRFDEGGVNIPFPQRDVHLHQVA